MVEGCDGEKRKFAMKWYFFVNLKLDIPENIMRRTLYKKNSVLMHV